MFHKYNYYTKGWTYTGFRVSGIKYIFFVINPLFIIPEYHLYLVLYILQIIFEKKNNGIYV